MGETLRIGKGGKKRQSTTIVQNITSLRAVDQRSDEVNPLDFEAHVKIRKDYH